MKSRVALALSPLLCLVACNPPAADRYVARVGMGERSAPSTPIDSPDTEGAVWVPSAQGANRLIYGKPGSPALFSLECALEKGVPNIIYTRFAEADPRAQAILALIGNGYVSRLKIDATREDGSWLWRGSEPALSRNFEGLTGARQVEATVPGAGSVILNASRLPGELIDRCRAQVPPRARE
ncbi:hypothetical protein [Qipengyuania sp.]|uniref:hypothetical protein n=1 Tax=Qipengyuania sp. TaxID=2004515 RepID=UPI0035C8755E